MKDKHLYAPKKALEESLRLQKLTSNIILSKSHKFSTFGYMAFATLVLWFAIFRYLPVPFNFKFPWTLFLSYGIGVAFSNYRPDGKPFIRYLVEYVLYLMVYGKRGTWYKGVFISKKEREKNNVKEI